MIEPVNEARSKLYRYGEGGDLVPYERGNGYQLQEFHWGSRIICSTSGDRIEFLLRLIARFPGPYDLWFVLEDNSGADEYRPGRYRTRTQLSPTQVQFFIRKFENLIRYEGNHHLMLRCNQTLGTVIYDQHDYFFVYGELDTLLSELRAEGFQETILGSDEHVHKLHDQLVQLHEMMAFWPWQWSQLELVDITPQRVPLLSRAWLKLRAIRINQTNKGRD